MGSYGPPGANWYSLDIAGGDVNNRRTPTDGAGTARGVGIPLHATNLGAWTVSNRRVTKTSNFNGYVRAAGDLFLSLGGTGWAPGSTHLIASNTNNIITLTAGPGQPLADNADTIGYIIPVGSLYAESRGMALHGLTVTTADPLDMSIELYSNIDDTLYMAIPIPAARVCPFPVPLGGTRGMQIPSSFSSRVVGSATTLAFTLYFNRVQ